MTEALDLVCRRASPRPRLGHLHDAAITASCAENRHPRRSRGSVTATGSFIEGTSGPETLSMFNPPGPSDDA